MREGINQRSAAAPRIWATSLMGRALFLLLVVAGMGVKLPTRSYLGNLLGVHVSVTPISNHQARAWC